MKKIIFLMLICFAVLNVVFAQNSYQNPESVTFSSENNVYFISNYGSGRVVVVDDNYAIVDTLVSGLDECLGIHLVGNTLFASCNNRLKGFDIDTGACIFDLLLPVENWLDGITSDASGNLYIVDTSGRIFYVTISSQNYAMVADTFPNYTQDIEFDEANNRLLVVAWSNNSPIYYLDLSDYSTGQIYGTNIGYFDGISIDNDGNVYVSSHINSGSVFKFESTLTEDPIEIEGDFNEPAGLYYNSYNDILAVPNFAGNSVEFIDVTGTQSVNNTLENPKQIEVRNFPNPFNPSTTITFSLNTENYENTEIVIYNLKGQKVKELYVILSGDEGSTNSKSSASSPSTTLRMTQAGSRQYSVTWNGTNQPGQPVSSGLYYAVLRQNGELLATHKMILMK